MVVLKKGNKKKVCQKINLKSMNGFSEGKFYFWYLFLVELIDEIIADEAVVKPKQFSIEPFGCKEFVRAVNRKHIVLFVERVHNIQATRCLNICFHKMSDGHFYRINFIIYVITVFLKEENKTAQLSTAHFNVAFISLLCGDEDDLCLFQNGNMIADRRKR